MPSDPGGICLCSDPLVLQSAFQPHTWCGPECQSIPRHTWLTGCILAGSRLSDLLDGVYSREKHPQCRRAREGATRPEAVIGLGLDFVVIWR